MKKKNTLSGKARFCMAACAFSLLMTAGAWGKIAVHAAVDVTQLQQKIADGKGGLPDDLGEKPLKARSLNRGKVPVYTDPDMMEVCGQADGTSLTVSVTDATKYAWFCEYESEDGSGMGWIEAKNFISDPDFAKEYATVRKDMPVYYKSNYKGGKTEIYQYQGIIIVSAPGKKHQVLYPTEEGYALGWMKSKDLEETLEYDGREKQLLVDGTYRLHSKAYNDGKKTYAEDPYPKTMTFVHLANDKYYMISGKGNWLGADTMNSGPEQHVSVNKTDTPMAEGLFIVERAEDGYTIRNDLTGYYLGLNEKGKLTLYEEEQGLSTVWRLSALDKMVDLEKPMVFTQYDPAWCGKPYGTDDITGCIGHAGCGLLAPINAVYALSGQYMDVFSLRDFAVDKGYRIIGSGTADGVFKGIAKQYGEQYGFAWDGSSDKISVLVKKLQQGDVAVSHVVGHYVAIVSCSTDGKNFLLLDSNRLPKRETSAFGDWVGVKRLEEGTLSSTGYFFYKPFDGKHVVEKKKKKKKKDKKDKKDKKAVEASTQESVKEE